MSIPSFIMFIAHFTHAHIQTKKKISGTRETPNVHTLTRRWAFNKLQPCDLGGMNSIYC